MLIAITHLFGRPLVQVELRLRQIPSQERHPSSIQYMLVKAPSTKCLTVSLLQSCVVAGCAPVERIDVYDFRFFKDTGEQLGSKAASSPRDEDSLLGWCTAGIIGITRCCLKPAGLGE